MEALVRGMTLALDDYRPVAVLILAGMGLTGMILVLAHLVGPKRHGPVKDSTYESGMEPVADARRRFNVKFYLVAVMYLVFGVEVLFLYPWAVMFPWLRAGVDADAGTGQTWASAAAAAGYSPGFIFVAILIFFLLLLVGFAYEWRKGIFRWD